MSVAILNRMVGVCFIEKVKLEQRLDRGQEPEIRQKTKSQCKGIKKGVFSKIVKKIIWLARRD